MVTLISPAQEQVIACRHCGSIDDLVRHGYTKGGNSRYRCRACKHTFCRNPGTTAHSQAFKEQVLKAYQERCSMRGVCRIFGISRTTLAHWLEKKSRSAATALEHAGCGQARRQAGDGRALVLCAP